jgi:hypothetical protein
MRGKRRARAQLAVTALVAALSCAPGFVRHAVAFAPIGPCCFADGSCDNLLEMACEDQEGTFIGVGPSCSQTICPTTQAAPMLTFFGLAAVIGGLIGLGLYRLVFRYR